MRNESEFILETTEERKKNREIIINEKNANVSQKKSSESIKTEKCPFIRKKCVVLECGECTVLSRSINRDCNEKKKKFESNNSKTMQ